MIYALNLQTSNHDAATPTRELVRIEQGARVKGGVHADGKSARSASTRRDCARSRRPRCSASPSRSTCCVLSLPLPGIVRDSSGAYGSRSTRTSRTIELLKVYGASGVMPGTFRDISPASAIRGPE